MRSQKYTAANSTVLSLRIPLATARLMADEAARRGVSRSTVARDWLRAGSQVHHPVKSSEAP